MGVRYFGCWRLGSSHWGSTQSPPFLVLHRCYKSYKNIWIYFIAKNKYSKAFEYLQTDGGLNSLTPRADGMSRLPFVNNNINNSLTTAYLPVIPPLGLSVNEDENALLAYSQPHHQQIWRLKRQSPLSHRSVKRSKKSIKYNICEVWTFWDCQEGSTCTFVILFYCHISSKMWMERDVVCLWSGVSLPGMGAIWLGPLQVIFREKEGNIMNKTEDIFMSDVI